MAQVISGEPNVNKVHRMGIWPDSGAIHQYTKQRRAGAEYTAYTNIVRRTFDDAYLCWGKIVINNKCRIGNSVLFIPNRIEKSALNRLTWGMEYTIKTLWDREGEGEIVRRKFFPFLLFTVHFLRHKLNWPSFFSTLSGGRDNKQTYSCRVLICPQWSTDACTKVRLM